MLVTYLQLLMLSTNLLKSPIPKSLYSGIGGYQLPTFDAESKSAKIQSLFKVGGGGGEVSNQLSTFDAESKSAEIWKSLYGWGRVGTGAQPESKPKFSFSR